MIKINRIIFFLGNIVSSGISANGLPQSLYACFDKFWVLSFISA